MGDILTASILDIETLGREAGKHAFIKKTQYKQMYQDFISVDKIKINSMKCLFSKKKLHNKISYQFVKFINEHNAMLSN